MKNLLLILPLSLIMSAAIAQSETKSYTSTASLDGKSYKITLSQRTSATGTSSGMNSSSSSTTTTPSTTGVDATGTAKTGSDVADVAASDKMDRKTTTETTNSSTGSRTTTTTASTQTKSGSQNMNMESLSNKKMILRFENGSIHSSGLTSHGITSCPYNVTSNAGTMISFNANCSGMIGSTKSGSMGSKTGTATDNTNDSYKSGSNTGDMSSGAGSTTNTTGTASMNTGSGTVQAMWSGTVDGTSIRGNFTWTSDNGQSYYYTFTGSKATQKDLDDEQELGSK